MLDDRFFLPTANKVAHRQMKDAARRLIGEYVTTFEDDLFRVWESERPFELRLDGVTISGRADVILDNEGGVEAALAILNYKTSTKGEGSHDLQLQLRERRPPEGLDEHGAYVHDLKNARRTDVDVTGAALSISELTVVEAAVRLKSRNFTANPGKSCRTCEVRTVCSAAIRTYTRS